MIKCVPILVLKQESAPVDERASKAGHTSTSTCSFSQRGKVIACCHQAASRVWSSQFPLQRHSCREQTAPSTKGTQSPFAPPSLSPTESFP